MMDIDRESLECMKIQTLPIVLLLAYLSRQSANEGQSCLAFRFSFPLQAVDPLDDLAECFADIVNPRRFSAME